VSSTAVRVSLCVLPSVAILACASALAGCQACVTDSSQPDPTQSQAQESRPMGTGPARIRPRLMQPAAGHLVLRDAGDGDE
jgi:hypothetical protein